MTALTHQIQREREAMREQWRSGFVAGVTLTLLVIVPLVIVALVMGVAK